MYKPTDIEKKTVLKATFLFKRIIIFLILYKEKNSTLFFVIDSNNMHSI